MRKITLFGLVAALALIALPTLADQAPQEVAPEVTEVAAEVTLDQIFTAEAEAAAEAVALEAVESVDGQEPVLLAGENCGGTICGKGTYCCNASCGWCRPYGMSCIQIACN